MDMKRAGAYAPSRSASLDSAMFVVDLEAGRSAPRTPAAPDSRSVARRAGAWAAAREFLAQGVGGLAGWAVREGVARGGMPAAVAAGVGSGAALGVASWRATQLITGTLLPDGPRRPAAATALVAALPLAAGAAAAAAAASAGALPSAAGVALGGIAERCVREALSKSMGALGPAARVVDRDGQPVPASDLAGQDRDAALFAMAPTAACEAARQWGLAPLQAALGGGATAAAAAEVLASALVEAGRGMSGTQAQRLAAADEEHELAPHAGSWGKLRSEAASGELARQVRDTAAMRLYFGAFADALDVYARLEDRTLPPTVAKALATQLKAMAELRNYFLKRGRAQEAAQRRQASVPLEPADSDDEAGIAGDDGIAPAGRHPPQDAVVLHIRPDVAARGWG